MSVAPPQPLLEARGIEKSFSGVRALHGVHLQVRQGEIHAVLGENGAGKSTLMHILAGIFPPDEGEIHLQGQPARFSNPLEAQRAGISMVFQERSLAGPLSVAENIFFGRQPTRKCGVIDREAMHRSSQEILQELGMEMRVDALVENLSPAEQQMVEIAKALSLNARLLVLDEPTAALNKSETVALFKVMKRLASRGVAIIYISHLLPEIYEICDRVTVLRDGGYQGSFELKDISEDALINRMVGRPLAELARRPNAGLAKSAPALEVRGLNDRLLLRDISFTAHAGQVTAIAGLAGSGRTELALCIFGARRITSGQVLVNGRPLSIRSPKDAIDAGIGYLTEDRKEMGVFLQMDAVENAAAAALDQFGSWWMDDRKLEQETLGIARRLRFNGRSTQAVEQLSGGNQQKVMLARWLLRRPSILVVDEPTRGIDIGAKREVYELLSGLAAEGTCIVLISSELPEILTLADRILVLRGGRIAGEVTRSEATQENILRMAALGVESRQATTEKLRGAQCRM
ncbi:MAG TPA: sugar ABC transporter ATP-binding protein [Verrucomicrobiae bacterium]|nr:sugar ABC transporter ATP-binding protein [Verrucomicrobiae bacterium]